MKHSRRHERTNCIESMLEEEKEQVPQLGEHRSPPLVVGGEVFVVGDIVKRNLGVDVGL